MKKILAHTLVAVLLGVVTMLAPFALFVSEMDTQTEPFYSSPAEYMKTRSSETEQTYGITPATYSTDVLFIAFMLTLGLVIALAVRRHCTKKLFFNALFGFFLCLVSLLRTKQVIVS